MWVVQYRKFNHSEVSIKSFDTESEARLWADAMMADGYLCEVSERT